MLKDKKLNNRLVSEILSHADFVQLMQAMEMYIDRKIMPQIASMNIMYQADHSTIQEYFENEDNEEIIAYFAGGHCCLGRIFPISAFISL